MNRLFWGIAFLLLATAAPWAQSTWRGQAEVWTAKSVPTDGLVAASNQFPLNTLLNVENYKTKKTIQVRVVAPLPAGSSDLVLLSPKAASALEIKVGEVPLVGVRIDPTGVDRPDNPDPDVNPLAQAPAAGASPAAAPGALPLPAVAGAVPLAVADEPDTTPATPGKRVFESTKSPDPVSTATPVPVNTAADSPVAAPDQSVAAPAADSAAVTAPSAIPLKTTPANAWVSVPRKLQGAVLGQVPVLASLEKGRPYVQLGTWATEAEMAVALDTVKSYVPLALYKAEGQKNPWRVVASAPKGQLGLLLMLFRSEGLRTAAVVKG